MSFPATINIAIASTASAAAVFGAAAFSIERAISCWRWSSNTASPAPSSPRDNGIRLSCHLACATLALVIGDVIVDPRLLHVLATVTVVNLDAFVPALPPARSFVVPVITILLGAYGLGLLLSNVTRWAGDALTRIVGKTRNRGVAAR
ncbi:hypothetical protein JMJ56_29775 [Belnapia sp. T18]|uniref:Uncharacterized protein n=1 Tax=Belnapia arida TaxID=2804533 RepID=A0ABS1UBY3_9PROT|nr:hypothetical protein [Belnapia arida]MBL6082169.1 hypothetical protein [Belnapia arida]